MNKNHKSNGKSLAKSYGLKAVFAKDDKVLIAVAGDKNKTVLEQKINKDNNTKEILIDPTKLEANINDNKTSILISKESYKDTFVNNPFYSKDNKQVGMDYLGIKDKLEKQFFGNTFNDNIHIQIAYKLLDIRKIVGLSVGNAIFSLNNLQPQEIKDKDIIGLIQTNIPFNNLNDKALNDDKKFIDNLLDYSRFFDNGFEKRSIMDTKELENKINDLKVGEQLNIDTVCSISYINEDNYHSYTKFKIGKIEAKYNNTFQDVKVNDNFKIKGIIKRNNDYKDKRNKLKRSYKLYKINDNQKDFLTYLNKDEIYNPDTYSFNYDILRIISYLRQSCVHNANNDYIDWFYNIDNKNDIKDLLNASNDVFNKQVNKFNKDFNKNSQKSVKMIASVLYDNPDSLIEDQIKDIYDKYYNFVFFKDNRNVGVNLRQVRKYIFDNHILVNTYDEKRLNNEKQKINLLLDYFIYQYFIDNKIQEETIDKLRKSINKVDKEKVYIDLVNEYINKNSTTINKIIKTVDSLLEEDSKEINYIPSYFKPSANINVCSFAKYIYILCKFLDPKETNNLLTSLINSFDNIGSLISILNTNTYNIFEPRFDLLNKKGCFDIAKDFIIVKNLVDMKEKLKKADVKDLTNKISKQIYCSAVNILSNKEYKLNDEEFNNIMEEFSSNKDGTYKGTPGSKVRNFLINNIINSTRFYYIIKYYDARKCYKLMQNEVLVRFVLEKEDTPDDVLIRYYKSIVNTTLLPTKKQMINTLVKSLKDVSFEFLFSKGKDLVDIGNNQDNKELESLKSLIGLYLLVCYWLIKGIVNVNSIYLLGWSAYERDMYYLYDLDIENTKDYDYLKAVKEFKEKKKCYKHHSELDKDIKEAEELISLNPNIFKEYRNKVCHYNVVLEVAEYLDGLKYVNSYYDIYNYSLQRYFSIKDNKLKQRLDELKTYCKDYVKLINMPFAYNMARYKNLTIADLFNDKYPKEQKSNNKDK